MSVRNRLRTRSSKWLLKESVGYQWKRGVGLSCRQLVRRLRRTGSTAGDRAGSTRKARLYSRFM